MHNPNFLLVGILITSFFLNVDVFAQNSSEIKLAKKIFEGTWVDKKTTRHLKIFIEKDGYVTINDWNSKFQKQESGDAYKATIQNGKLIMPQDLEHHAPYSEIIIQNEKLVYVTEYTSIPGKAIVNKQIFVREY